MKILRRLTLKFDKPARYQGKDKPRITRMGTDGILDIREIRGLTFSNFHPARSLALRGMVI